MVRILADTRLRGDEFLAVTDEHMCVAVHPCRVKNYSNSCVRGYGLLGDLYLIIRQLQQKL